MSERFHSQSCQVFRNAVQVTWASLDTAHRQTNTQARRLAQKAHSTTSLAALTAGSSIVCGKKPSVMSQAQELTSPPMCKRVALKLAIDLADPLE